MLRERAERGSARLNGAYGTFTFNPATGQWTYALNPSLSDPLTAGQIATMTIAAIALVLALGIGFYFAQLVAARVKRIEEAARKIADGDFAARIPVQSSGQLGQLARTFNEMQRRLGQLDSLTGLHPRDVQRGVLVLDPDR